MLANESSNFDAMQHTVPWDTRNFRTKISFNNALKVTYHEQQCTISTFKWDLFMIPIYAFE